MAESLNLWETLDGKVYKEVVDPLEFRVARAAVVQHLIHPFCNKLSLCNLSTQNSIKFESKKRKRQRIWKE
jgi:hypothetical protein